MNKTYQIAWLTHSSPQFFEPFKWNTFQRVHKANRAKIALALEFDSIVIAVLSNDLLVQVSLEVNCCGVKLTLFPHPLSFVGGHQGIMTSATTFLRILMSLSRRHAFGLRSRFSHVLGVIHTRVVTKRSLETKVFHLESLQPMLSVSGAMMFSVALGHTVFKKLPFEQVCTHPDALWCECRLSLFRVISIPHCF